VITKQWRIMWNHASGDEVGAVWRDESPSASLLSEWAEDFSPMNIWVETRKVTTTKPVHDHSFDQYTKRVSNE
jgi:hypothetical protein